MDKHPNPPYHPPQFTRTTPKKSIFTSCILALTFLILLLVALSLTIFFLFRPKNPTIQITSVSFPSFSSSNNSVSFTFSQHASVSNPNRAAFSHYDSSINLMYGNSRVGFMYIPAGEIGGGITQFMEASFSVGKFDLRGNDDALAMEMRMRVVGRVRVLKVLMHRVQAVKKCWVGVRVGSGGVVGVRC